MQEFVLTPRFNVLFDDVGGYRPGFGKFIFNRGQLTTAEKVAILDTVAAHGIEVERNSIQVGKGRDLFDRNWLSGEIRFVVRVPLSMSPAELDQAIDESTREAQQKIREMQPERSRGHKLRVTGSADIISYSDDPNVRPSHDLTFRFNTEEIEVGAVEELRKLLAKEGIIVGDNQETEITAGGSILGGRIIFPKAAVVFNNVSFAKDDLIWSRISLGVVAQRIGRAFQDQHNQLHEQQQDIQTAVSQAATTAEITPPPEAGVSQAGPREPRVYGIPGENERAVLAVEINSPTGAQAELTSDQLAIIREVLAANNVTASDVSYSHSGQMSIGSMRTNFIESTARPVGIHEIANRINERFRGGR